MVCTDLFAPMVPVEKKNKDQVRVCMDLKQLNKEVKRERYILSLHSQRFMQILANPVGGE